MSHLRPVELIRHAAAGALSAADVLLAEWLPEGKRKGREWVAANIARGDRQAGSFGVSLDTGRWNDFADSGAHGG
ncbi:MAG: DNA primase, partial [Achromobacter sp.]|nr:DNA primase [Achromobacter sp.]